MYQNPVYQKEMTAAVRSKKQAIVWIIFCNLLMLTGLISLDICSARAEQIGYIDYSVMLRLYVLLTAAMFLLVLLYIPLTAGAAVSEEYENHTLDLLLHTAISPTRIVLGKLCAILVNTLFMCMLSLPVLALVFIFGGIRMLDIFELIGFLIVEILYCASTGMAISSLFHYRTPAIFVTYCLMLLINLPGLYPLKVGILGLADTDLHFQLGFFYGYYLMLPAPTAAFYELISAQTGTNNAILQIVNRGIPRPATLISSHWIAASLLLHLLITAAAVAFTIYRIHPKHRRI